MVIDPVMQFAEVNRYSCMNATPRFQKGRTMEKIKVKCETCRFRGYSLDFCKLHLKNISDITDENCHTHSHELYKKMGKTVAVGADVGVLATTVGIAAVPAIGLKTIIGHSMIGHTLAAKLTAGGGAAGAGVNVARNSKKSRYKGYEKRKRSVLLPLYLKKGS